MQTQREALARAAAREVEADLPRLEEFVPDGMLAFINGLKAEGITQAQIDAMEKKNPAKLLGLES